MMKAWLLSKARRHLSVETRRQIVRLMRWPPVGLVRFGSLRRVKPISSDWGTDRGLPIDRYYIEKFLQHHAGDIQGRVLEIGDDSYSRRFGGTRITQQDVLHVAENRSQVTIIGDLTNAQNIEPDIFDCFILTQTLQAIYDVKSAIQTVHRVLKPGGVALVTVPGISKISRYDMDRWGYYWSFTTKSMQQLLVDAGFLPENLHIHSHGNVLASIAFLHGLAANEVRHAELEYTDPDFELLITVRAIKARAIDAPPGT